MKRRKKRTSLFNRRLKYVEPAQEPEPEKKRPVKKRTPKKKKKGQGES